MLFDGSNEASWCTDYNAKKNKNSFWWTVFEKIRFFPPKCPNKMGLFCHSFSRFFPKWYKKKHGQFLLHWTKWIQPLHISLQTPYEHDKFWKKSDKLQKESNFFGPFCWSSIIFSKMVTQNEFLFFALQSVHQDASFELSNSTIRWFSIFTLVRVPFDLGGSEHYAKGMDWSNTVFNEFFLDLMAFLIHINVSAKKVKTLFLDTAMAYYWRKKQPAIDSKLS